MQLSEASREAGPCQADVDHEMRTAVHTIIGFASMLADGTLGPLNLRQQRYVGNILNSGKRLFQLINDAEDAPK